MLPQKQGRQQVEGHAARGVPGTAACRLKGDGPGWLRKGGGRGCVGEPWLARAWYETDRWWSPLRWQVQLQLQWPRLWLRQSPEIPSWLHCQVYYSSTREAFLLNPHWPHNVQKTPSAVLIPHPLTARKASTTGEPPRIEPQGTLLRLWLLPLLPCRPSPTSHYPRKKQHFFSKWFISLLIFSRRLKLIYILTLKTSANKCLYY